MLRRLGRCLARYLDQPIRRYEPLAVIPLDCVASVLRPADILLVEGKFRVSTAIKYLTQSTWSHAALFVGDFRETGLGLQAPTLIEADLEHGVWRCRLLSLGSGSPTRAICSTLIAQAFQSVRYPILPHVEQTGDNRLTQGAREVLHVRHHSLFTPRDFDISPYFEILKPEVECGFDYHALRWDAEEAARRTIRTPASCDI